jgi:hypothetical protein
LAWAIWNDATSVVDIGDLTIVDRARGGLTFAEVKEGKVNDALISALDGSRDGNVEPLVDFLRTYGASGEAQAKRFFRQQEVTGGVLKILKDDRGVDPFSGQNVILLDGGVPEERFDDELQAVIDAARSKGVASAVVDDCLTIRVAFPSTDSVARSGEVQESEILRATDITDEPKLDEAGNRITRGDLSDALHFPIARPSYLLSLKATDILELLLGDLFHRVHFELDWNAFERLVASAGGAIRWSSVREGRRERSKRPAGRLLTVGDQIPTVMCDGAEMQCGGPLVQRMFFDLVRPRMMAAELIESTRAFGRLSKDERPREKGPGGQPST